ncbi:hypothetical protein ALP73_05277 [Pseudomonas coronafaciens pv. garcae]|nr:hypothetical protein ALP73_05277 [Pseudomonas coronafaciens pv. garcae]
MRQGLGRLLPRIRVDDRLGILVLVLRQQFGLNGLRQLEVLYADRTRIAFGQPDLTGIAERVLTRQLGGVRVFGVFVDNGGVPGNHRAIRRDQHYVVVRIGHLGLVAQPVEVPDHTHFDFAFLHSLDSRVGERQTLLLSQFGEQLQARFDVGFVAFHGDGSCQYTVCGLGSSTHVADRNLIFTGFQVSPAFWYFRTVQQVLVDDKGDGAGVGQRPVPFLVFGPGRDLIPGGWLVKLGHALRHGDGAEGCAHVSDVGAGVIFFRIELGDLLGRAHVGVHVLEAVLGFQVLPDAAPVSPVIRHASAIHSAFSLGRGLKGFQIRVRSHGQGTHCHG